MSAVDDFAEAEFQAQVRVVLLAIAALRAPAEPLADDVMRCAFHVSEELARFGSAEQARRWAAFAHRIADPGGGAWLTALGNG